MRHLILAALLVGCVKPAPPVQAPTVLPVVAAAMRTDLETTTPVATPERLQAAMAHAFEKRNLDPRMVEDDAIDGIFGEGRNSGHRLGQLASWGQGAELAVLVEAETLYVSQIAGRYRWEVSVTLTVADTDALDAALVRQFTVPVFLQFYREREDAALAEATPNIERRLGELLDEILVARQGG